ncbi:hypothetical protein DdX_02660 [Ditylenchus destructor]|uniref:Uncharacterized protein n=1 Tax=Ditylenchus destructor TaxID=166010 RepID=A0AAD4NF82_9BILA|nr:hypothetical protein DdX_02660 [Ditylenchus destructor]
MSAGYRRNSFISNNTAVSDKSDKVINEEDFWDCGEAGCCGPWREPTEVYDKKLNTKDKRRSSLANNARFDDAQSSNVSKSSKYSYGKPKITEATQTSLENFPTIGTFSEDTFLEPIIKTSDENIQTELFGQTARKLSMTQPTVNFFPPAYDPGTAYEINRPQKTENERRFPSPPPIYRERNNTKTGKTDHDDAVSYSTTSTSYYRQFPPKPPKYSKCNTYHNGNSSSNSSLHSESKRIFYSKNHGQYLSKFPGIHDVGTQVEIERDQEKISVADKFSIISEASKASLPSKTDSVKSSPKAKSVASDDNAPVQRRPAQSLSSQPRPRSKSSINSGAVGDNLDHNDLEEIASTQNKKPQRTIDHVVYNVAPNTITRFRNKSENRSPRNDNSDPIRSRRHEKSLSLRRIPLLLSLSPKKSAPQNTARRYKTEIEAANSDTWRKNRKNFNAVNDSPEKSNLMKKSARTVIPSRKMNAVRTVKRFTVPKPQTRDNIERVSEDSSLKYVGPIFKPPNLNKVGKNLVIRPLTNSGSRSKKELLPPSKQFIVGKAPEPKTAYLVSKQMKPKPKTKIPRSEITVNNHFTKEFIDDID